MNRNKIILVIVEGLSEQIALEYYFSCLLNEVSSIRFHIVHGDVTSDFTSNQGNIRSKIGDMVLSEMRRYRLRKSDILEIVHIADTDGAFIPNDSVIEDSNTDGVFYELNRIRTSNAKRIIDRNLRKQSNLYKLITCNHILDIPYHIYYMSCNLDHVLYDKPNSSESEKIDNSKNFSCKYYDNLKGFLEFIMLSEFSVSLDYNHSWDFIQLGCNSLCRYSNINLLFDRLLNGEEYKK